MRRFGLLVTILLVSCQPNACQNKQEGVSAERGKILYDRHCASCHGTKGDGKGPAAELLWPRPRDFTAGIFKYRSGRGPIPSDLDLLQTMKLGVPGTAMPGWDMLTMEDWHSILTHVRSFSPRLLNQKPGPDFEIPEEPKATSEAIAGGKMLYEKSGCVACHGPEGKGDGPGAVVLKDVWGDRVAPRDLTRGPLKWGNNSKEIYRTLMAGIPGTPMPSFEHTFTKEEMWSLVHFLQSIQKKLPEGYDPSHPARNLLVAKKISGEIPLDIDNDLWLEAPAIPVFLKPLWHEPNMTEWLSIRALHNGKEVAFMLEWEDDQMNIDPGQSDSAAIQFPTEKITNPVELPYLGIGGPSKDVSVWEPKVKVYDHGKWVAIFKASPPTGPLGYLSLTLWDEDLPQHRGPESFSEWIAYELREAQ